MRTDRSRSYFFLGAALGAACGAFAAGPQARAEVPSAPPVFTQPLEFTNEFFPFTPGDVKVYRGKAGKRRLAATDQYLAETRDFTWKGATVPTRIVREVEFENGKLVEISKNYFAQADDGTVYYFGEVTDDYEDGAVVGHEGSWLVGGPSLPTDPAETAPASDPTVFMPANPEIGDQFKPDDLLPIADETATVEEFVKKMKVEAGTFEDVMRVKLTSVLPDSEPEKKWYARGVGVIRAKEEGEILELIAATQVPIQPK